MKVWLVERHWGLDVSIMGLYSTREKAKAMAESEAKTEKFKPFYWKSFDGNKVDMLLPYYDNDFYIYVVEMEVR